MSGPRKLVVRGEDSRAEVLFEAGDDECFVTVARSGDAEDDDRVAILTPSEALKVATKLIQFATAAMKDGAR